MSASGRRNLAVVIFVFFGSVAGAGFLWIILDQAWQPMIGMAENASNTSGTSQGISDAKTAWNNGLAFVLPLVLILGIAGAAFSRAGGS